MVAKLDDIDCVQRPGVKGMAFMSTELQTHMDALRSLAKSNDLRQAMLVEQTIDGYLKANGARLSHALESLRNAIHQEQMANRGGEDWSTPRDYVRRMLHRYSLMFEANHPGARLEASE